MQLFLSAKSSTVCDWFNNTQITKCLQPPGFLLCPECQIHSWICCKVLATSSSAMLHALADKHTHLAGHELTVGPVAPVQCTQAVLSPVCGWGVCLLGSAEELCYETQSLKAELLVDGPALPDKPDTNTHKKKTHSHTMFFYLFVVYRHKGAAVWITRLNLFFVVAQSKWNNWRAETVAASSWTTADATEGWISTVSEKTPSWKHVCLHRRHFLLAFCNSSL